MNRLYPEKDIVFKNIILSKNFINGKDGNNAITIIKNNKSYNYSIVPNNKKLYKIIKNGCTVGNYNEDSEYYNSELFTEYDLKLELEYLMKISFYEIFYHIIND